MSTPGPRRPPKDPQRPQPQGPAHGRGQDPQVLAAKAGSRLTPPENRPPWEVKKEQAQRSKGRPKRQQVDDRQPSQEARPAAQASEYQRPEPRANQQPNQRPEQRADQRPYQRLEKRHEVRPNQRTAQRVEPDPEQHGEHRAPRDGAKAAPRGTRQALSNLGGTTRMTGDPSWFDVIRRALDVPEDPEAARYLTHAFHAWPARLHPHTARSLVASFAGQIFPGRAGVFADPFMGGGTVLVEAMLAGHSAVGTDLNPIGQEVAWVRTRRFSHRFLSGLKARLEGFIRQARLFREDEPVDRRLVERVGMWFDAPVLAELWSLGAILNARLDEAPDDAAARIIRAALSSIVVKVSRQVSDSVSKVGRPTNQGGPQRPMRAGTVERWVGARLHELTGQLAAFAEHLPAHAKEAEVFTADARKPPQSIGQGTPIDAIISSPPYLGVYDYVQHHLLRLSVLGLDPRGLADGEVGSRREQRRVGDVTAAQRYEDDLGAVLTAWRPRMREGGILAFMIGDGQLGQDILPILPLIDRVAPTSGWIPVTAGSQARPAFIPGRRTPGIKEEHLVILATGPASRTPAPEHTQSRRRGR